MGNYFARIPAYTLIAVGIVTLMLACMGASAQTSQVRCESTMFPGEIQIFEGWSCPPGWFPA